MVFNSAFKGLRNLSRKFKFQKSLTIITGTLDEDQCAFMVASRSVHLRITYCSEKNCTENQNTHYIFSSFFFFEDRAVYATM